MNQIETLRDLENLPIDDLSLENALQDSVTYIDTILGAHLEDYQVRIAEAVEKYDEVAVRSCHAIGKSFTSARIGIAFLGVNPESILWTTAPTYRQVYNILWREIRSAVKSARIPLGGEILKTRWEINQDWYGFGFATDSGEQFQGLHSKSSKILGIMDEASGISDAIYEASEGTLTSQGAKRLALGNPNRKSGRFYDSFKRRGVHTIKISAYDTPNFIVNGIKNSKDLIDFHNRHGIENAKIIRPHLITPKFAYRILENYGENSNNFLVRVEAEFPLSDDNTLIDLSLIEGAMNRKVTVYKSDEEVIACDPARYGTDRTCILYRKGKKVYRKWLFTKFATTEVSGMLIKLKREHPKALIKIDTIGLGAGVHDEVMEVAKAERWGKDVIAVNFAEKAVDEKEYTNLRTEAWFNARDFLKDGSIPMDEDFKEGAEVKYYFTSKGQQQLESKDDIKARIGKSPDTFDALAISVSNPHVKKEPRVRVI
jgi:phage terminase large subunit